MVDVVKDIRVHIQRQLEKGYSIADIERALIDVGFPRDSINEAMKGLKQKGEKPAEKTSFFGWLKPKPAAASKPAPKAEVKKPESKPAPKPEIKPPVKPTERRGLFGLFRPVPAPKAVTKPEIKKPEPPKLEKKPAAKSWFSWGAAKPEKPAVKEAPIKKPEPKPEIKKPSEKRGLFGWFRRTPVKEAPKPVKKPEVKQLPRRTTYEEAYRKNLRSGFVITILLILFFAIIGLIIWLFPAACATETCFINHANACKAARYTNNIEGTVILYEVNNCILRKTIKELAPDEPSKIVEKFLGKSMLCTYAKNDFNPLHVRTISGMVNTCQGPLKDAILDYVV